METVTSEMTLDPRPAGFAGGWRWIVGGYRLFAKAPWAWVGLILLTLLLYIALAIFSWVPGMAMVAILLPPVLSAGVMLGCQELQAGRRLRAGHLFAAFRSNRLPFLLVLGAFWVAGSWVITSQILPRLLGSTLNEALAAAMLGGGFTFEVVKTFLPTLWVLLVSYLVLAMLLWFAPQLVVLGGVNPLRAVVLSLSACLNNPLPLLLWALLALLASMGGAMLLGLGLLVAIPVIWASNYAAYRDIFAIEADEATLSPQSEAKTQTVSRQPSTSKAIKVGGLVAVLVIAIPVGCVGVQLSVNSAGRDFFRDVAAKDYTAAEAHLSPALTQTLSEGGNSLPQVISWMGLADAERTAWSGSSFDNGTAELKLDVTTRAGNSIPVELKFEFDGGWKITSIMRPNWKPETGIEQHASAGSAPSGKSRVRVQTEVTWANGAGEGLSEEEKRAIEKAMLEQMGTIPPAQSSSLEN